MYYLINIRPAAGTIRVPAMEWDETQESWCIKESPLKTEQTIWPNNEDGREKRWRWEYKTVMERNHELTIRKDRTGQSYVYAKRRPHDEGVVSVSSWFDAKYSATEHGTALLKDLFGNSPFSYPKSIYAVEDAIYIGGANKLGAWVLDYFAGSGTTGHAVINLNRRNGGTRKFVLVEAGRHFSTVILPRIKKVSFTSSWSGGKPLALATAEDVSKSQSPYKVLRLESYEDTLNNLELLRTADQQRLLSDIEAQGVGGLREQYTLGYMLDVESGQSQSLLNTRAFQDPTQYKLRVRRPGSDESSETNVDLLETFNWLIGLSVQHIAAPTTIAAELNRDEEKRLRVKGRIRQDDSGPWWFRSVTGTTPDGRKTLIIWRKLTGDPEADSLVLDEWFTKQGYSTKDYEFQLIYVNGDNNLENLKAPDDTWKVRLIEEDFHRLMFDTEGL